MYIYIQNGEFHTKLFEKRDNFGFDFAKMPFYCSNISSKMLYEGIAAEFLRISRATSKIEVLSLPCKQSNVTKKWTNKENQIFLDKNVPTTPRSFD